ncbi:MAG: glycosyltransferase family 4 protein [Desulfofustis sp.]|nr:glycosyltransferase family 4 protein [Desulfofustis sp.]
MAFKILLTSIDFRPKLGGVATCSYELAKALHEIPGVEVEFLAPEISGHEEFDQTCPFPVHRAQLPDSFKAVLPLSLKILAVCYRSRPNLVINMLWLPCGFATFLIRPFLFLLGIKQAIFVHAVEIMESGSSKKKSLRRKMRFLKRRCFQAADHCFAVSNYTKNLIISECGVKSEEITVSFNGVDYQKYSPGPKNARLEARMGSEGKKIFFTITRLDDYKGIDKSLDAFALLQNRYPDSQFLIAGDGGDRPRIEKLIHSLKLEKSVKLLGRISDEELIEFYRLADCYVMLSREDLDAPNVEGFGIVFLEAAACELPIIAGNSGGIPDAVADQENGILVTPTDIEEVARAMEKMIVDTALSLQYGKSGRERVINKFSWPHMANRVISNYVRN